MAIGSCKMKCALAGYAVLRVDAGATLSQTPHDSDLAVASGTTKVTDQFFVGVAATC